MAHVTATASAGMLWPGPKTIPFGGSGRTILPFRVRDIAAIEEAAADLFGEPFRGLEESFAARRAGRDHRGYIDHVQRIVGRLKDWPPRLGSNLFSEVLATAGGFSAYLWVLLSRSDARIVPEDIPEIASRATPGEFAAAGRIAWGRPSWAIDEPDDGRSRPLAWGELASLLARECGYTYPQIGEMTLSQFFNEISAGQPRRYAIPDPPEAPAP